MLLQKALYAIPVPTLDHECTTKMTNVTVYRDKGQM